MSNKVVNYIRTRSARTLQEQQERYIHNTVLIYIKDKLPANFDLGMVITKLEETIPVSLISQIDSVYIGQFDEINGRNLESIYKDGAIYITNEQLSEYLMYESIVHELAHALEELYKFDIYLDDSIEREFLGKRKKLFDILRAEDYNISIEPFLKIGYSKEFDEFLYKKIGYSTLTTLTMGLFVSPYGATSMREYFANGFEEYYTGNPESLRKISPQLYTKIYNLVEE
tara:strand:+ start:883 stop:1566 length:684 start_codon:yes stop_codon:yes gene_type:complete